MVKRMLSMSGVENTYLMLKRDHGKRRFTFMYYKAKK